MDGAPKRQCLKCMDIEIFRLDATAPSRPNAITIFSFPEAEKEKMVKDGAISAGVAGFVHLIL